MEPVVDNIRQILYLTDAQQQAGIAYFQENPGLIVVAFDICHATELIDANPIGLCTLPVG